MKKNIKKIIKKYKIHIIISFVISCLLITGISFTYADEEFKWDKDNKKNAWTVYSFTDWIEIQGLNFGNEGSYTTANVDEIFKMTYEKRIKKVLGDEDVPNGLYDSQEYTELILYVLYYLDQTGTTKTGAGLYETEVRNYTKDYFYSWKLTGNDFTKENKDAILAIYNDFITLESAYSVKYEPVCIYQPDKRLASVIQGLLYGEGYTTSHENYKADKAQTYFTNHITSVYCTNDCSGFGQDFLNNFSGVLANEHTVIG